MPLSVSAETVRAGPATRKRTYDQITRSQSRSQTPTIPAKRRRTDPSESRSSNSSRQPSAQPFPQRFEGDGFDFRRPTASAMAQAEDQTTIDLTLEDNTPPPVLQDLTEDDDNDELSSLFDDSEYVEDLLQIAAPPSNRQQGQNPTEPITISDSEDEDLPADGRPPQPPESPEVQWVGQRPIARRLPSPHPQNLPSLADILRRPSSQPELRRATPPELRRADAQSFRDHLRNVPGAIYDFGRNVFGAAMVPVLPPTTAAFQNFGNLHGNTRFYARNIPTPLDPTIYDDEDDYGAIDLDYHDVGFPMGGLEIIDPVADEAVAALATEDAYKPPPVPREGFTRDIQEDSDVLICVACEDELATGEDEVKQQVWVAKTCGHVFCGSCASQRLSYRKGNDRDRKRAKRPKVDQLKACKAPNCGSRLTGKTSMFQIYL